MHVHVLAFRRTQWDVSPEIRAATPVALCRRRGPLADRFFHATKSWTWCADCLLIADELEAIGRPLQTFFAGKEVRMPVGFFSRGGKLSAHLKPDRHRAFPLQGFLRDERLTTRRRTDAARAAARAAAVSAARRPLPLLQVGA